MKKAITILMLAIAIIAGGAAAEAKTTKKSSRSSSSSSLSLSTFTTSQSGSKFLRFCSESSIESSLKKLGFKCDYRNVSREFNDQFNEYENVLRFSYSKGGTTVIFDDYFITINFTSSSAKDAFIKTATSKGYRYNSSYGDGCYMIPGNESQYWEGVFMYVNGNSIQLSGGGE